MEKWKNIKGYEGLYQVSNEGRIKTLERKINTGNGGHRISKEKILKCRVNKLNGYSYAHLYIKRKQQGLRVNRLVAEAFLGLNRSDKKSIVMHLDNIKTNNHVDNLKIGTCMQNTKQCIRDGRFITHKKRRSCIKYKIQTILIRILRTLGFTNGYIGDKFGWSKSYISLIYSKKRRVYIK